MRADARPISRTGRCDTMYWPSRRSRRLLERARFTPRHGARARSCRGARYAARHAPDARPDGAAACRRIACYITYRAKRMMMEASRKLTPRSSHFELLNTHSRNGKSARYRGRDYSLPGEEPRRPAPWPHYAASLEGRPLSLKNSAFVDADGHY